MDFKEINFSKAEFNPLDKIPNDWFLVTSGDESGYNTMTASWGTLGHLWGKNVFQTVIRPQRYTKKFVDDNDYFTISFLPKEYKKALAYCGAHSGKDVDKSKETGITPLFIDGTTAFEQAELVIICKKIYVQEMKEDCFLDKSVLSHYENKDFHFAYYGEIIKVLSK